MALLEISSACSGYGGAPVLKDVSLSIDEGEVVALLGSNGAGKSTTILTIGGEVPLASGTIEFDGATLRGPLHSRAKQGIALITDDRSLFAQMSVRDNLKLGRSDMALALDLFGELGPLLNRRAGLLSGGEQQMLSVARVLAARPRVVLVDELSLGLAPLIVDRLLNAISEVASTGTAVLLVEQHARKALAVADRAYVLCRGSVQLEGSGSSLLERFDEVQRAYLSPGA
ncbi:ABC transporter ATP-binding protein [Aeromicrobium sp.]|uniref:ABC transporter ATP-binding protein n=1 Tax=Aeromicrobium sp. TaxID=1871063 RepID=UPI002FCAE9A1